MTNNIWNFIKYLIVEVCTFIVVVLMFIGAQFVIKGNVEYDVIDNFVVLCITVYLARDVIGIENKLKKYNKVKTNKTKGVI